MYVITKNGELQEPKWRGAPEPDGPFLSDTWYDMLLDGSANEFELSKIIIKNDYLLADYAWEILSERNPRAIVYRHIIYESVNQAVKTKAWLRMLKCSDVCMDDFIFVRDRCAGIDVCNEAKHFIDWLQSNS